MIKSLLLSVFTLICFQLTSQDFVQVSVGPQYGLQAFYNLDTDETLQIPEDTWDLAFSNVGRQDAGVIINEGAPLMGAALELYSAEFQDWDNPLSSVDSLNDNRRLYNLEANWTEGAFNANKNPSNPFDYGWGEYNPQEQRVVGSAVFIIVMRDASIKKIQILESGAEDYTIRYAELDGTEEQTVIVERPAGFTHALFSFDDNTSFPMPKDYDLIFMRYAKPLDDGAGGLLDYIVLGTLSAPGVSSAVALGVDPMTVDHADYFGSYNDRPDNIGHDWKNFDLNEGGWVVYEDRSQFVKAKSGNIYQITFVDFEGSSTGVSTFQKTLIGSTSTTDALDIDLKVFPNPVTDFINIESDSAFDKAFLLDISGRLIKEYDQVENRLEIPSDSVDGLHTIMLQTGDKVISRKIMIGK